MRHKFLTAAAVALCMAAANPKAMNADTRVNPFLQPYTTQYEIPPFEQITIADFAPATEAGIREQRANLEKIINNPEAPTFDNTILPLENLSPILDRVEGVFYHYDAAMKSPAISALGEELIPMFMAASNEVMLNDKLFERIKTLRDNLKKQKLNPVQKRLVEKYYKQFAEQGAPISRKSWCV